MPLSLIIESSPPVSPPALEQKIHGGFSFLYDSIPNRSQRSSPSMYIPPTHPIILSFNTSKNSLGTHHLSSTGKEVRSLRTLTALPPFKSKLLAVSPALQPSTSYSLPVPLQQNTSYNLPVPPLLLPTPPVTSTVHTFLTSLSTFIALGQTPILAVTFCLPKPLPHVHV